MKFIPSRDLRVRLGDVWRELQAEGGVVVTSNGQPVAVMIPTSGEDLERTWSALRRARALEAAERMQDTSVRKGLDRVGADEVDREVRRARRARRG